MTGNNIKYAPQQKWSKTHDYIVKGFRMYKVLADRFKIACDKAGRSQASVITELMEKFIAEHGEKTE